MYTVNLINIYFLFQISAFELSIEQRIGKKNQFSQKY